MFRYLFLSKGNLQDVDILRFGPRSLQHLYVLEEDKQLLEQIQFHKSGFNQVSLINRTED